MNLQSLFLNEWIHNDFDVSSVLIASMVNIVR